MGLRSIGSAGWVSPGLELQTLGWAVCQDRSTSAELGQDGDPEVQLCDEIPALTHSQYKCVYVETLSATLQIVCLYTILLTELKQPSARKLGKVLTALTPLFCWSDL